MAVYRYGPEVHEFVREHCSGMRPDALAKACNEALGTAFTANGMRSFMHNHSYKSGLPKGLTREELWERQTRYPREVLQFIRENSLGVPSKEMAELVNEKFGTDFTPTRMKQFRQRWGIKSGVTGWFRKGRAPGNKGKKLEEYIKDPERLEEIRARMAPTQFKKGDRPWDEVPVGTISVTKDGYKVRKKQMKGSQWERWEFVHRATWEEHNGPIPDGMIIAFRDGDRSNCDISNLMMITRGEAAQLTKLGLRSEDPELTDAGLAVVRLRTAANERRKNGSSKAKAKV